MINPDVYSEMIHRCIASCVTIEQIQVCECMIEAFIYHYAESPHEAWTRNAANDLYKACSLKSELPSFGGYPSVRATFNETPLT